MDTLKLLGNIGLIAELSLEIYKTQLKDHGAKIIHSQPAIITLLEHSNLAQIYQTIQLLNV